MDKKDKKPGGSSLSAGDLRARLGLKPRKTGTFDPQAKPKSSPKVKAPGAKSSADDLRARLGLGKSAPGLPTAKPAQKEDLVEALDVDPDDFDFEAPAPELDSSAPVMGAADTLPVGGAHNANATAPAPTPEPEPEPVVEEEPPAAFTMHQAPQESTQALSLDEFEDLLVDDELDGFDDDFGGIFDEEPAASPTPEPVAEAPAPEPQPETEPEPETVDPADLGIEEEEEDDLAGEATSIIDTSELFGDDDDFDAFPDGEATQMMTAMEHDPLSAILYVEAGTAPQQQYNILRDRSVIGRGTKNEITISDLAMSRRHMSLERSDGGFTIRDLDSGNGTKVNGRRIKSAQLRNGDLIEAGNLTFRFEQSGGDPDKLWKGTPNIDYHPKDKGEPSPSASRPSPQQQQQRHSAPQQAQPAQPAAQPQVLLTNTNAAFQAFGAQQQPGMMPGQPGMMPGQPGMMPGMAQPRRKGSPVVTVLIVCFAILLLGLIGLIVYTISSKKGAEKPAETGPVEPVADPALAQKHFTNGLSLYNGINLNDPTSKWETVKLEFTKALEADPSHNLAKEYLAKHIKRGQREQSEIREIRDSVLDSTKKLDSTDYNQALNRLKNIDANSLFYSTVQNQVIPDVKEKFRDFLIAKAEESLKAANEALDKKDSTEAKTRIGESELTINTLRKDLDYDKHHQVKKLYEELLKAKANLQKLK